MLLLESHAYRYCAPSFSWLHALRSAFLVTAVLLLFPRLAHTAAPLTIAFNSTGLSSVNYNGTEFLQYGDLRLDGITFLTPGGSTFAGGTTSTVSINAGAQTQTRTFNWGTIVVSYVVAGNRLTINATVNNQTANTIQGIWVEPMGMHFPSEPVEYGPGYPLMVNNLGQPAVQTTTYGSGVMALVADDDWKPLLLGFPYALDGPADTIFPITFNTDRVASYCSCLPTINRPIGPNSSDTFVFSLRFGPPGSDAATLAPEVYTAYSAAYPPTYFWPDRRPIGSLHLSTLTQGLSGWSTNPRGWLSDQTIDVTNPAGIAALSQRILAYADTSIGILQSMNAQGMITWDIEGQQFAGYISDPTAFATAAPEMAGIADAYFKKFRDAGFRIGLNLRSQQFILSPDGSSIQQNFVSDPTQLLINKATYAHNRWGATLYYVDSNVDNYVDNQPIAPSIIEALQSALPDCLFMPEHSNLAYYAYSAPYRELQGGFTGTPPETHVAYPNSFTVIYTGDGPIQQDFNTLVSAVQAGDVFLYRSWWNDPENQLLQQIYQQAWPTPPILVNVTPPAAFAGPGQTVQLSAIVADSSNQQVSWKVASGGGSISSAGLYTAPASVPSPQAVTVVATSAADATKSGKALLTVSPHVAVSLLPQTDTLGPHQIVQFNATVAGNTNQNVTWSIVSGPGTLSPTGLYQAPAPITSTQTVTVQAVSATDSTKAATAAITLSPAASISLTPTSALLTVNQTVQFTPTVSGLSSQQVTWSIAPAGTGTVSGNGLYTAPASITSTQTVSVIATSTADSTKYASATVMLNPSVTVSVAPLSITLSAGQTQQFTAAVANASNSAVTWALQGAGTITQTGLYTAPSPIASDQSVTVVATSAADASKSSTATIALKKSLVCPAAATNAFTGCYYLDQTYGSTSGLGFVRTDPSINFNWGTSGAGSGVGPNNFSVRWQGNFAFAAGVYTFTLATDDGSTLFVDGQQVLSEPGVHAAFTSTQSVSLAAGTHLIELDYFQAAGGAQAYLAWAAATISVSLSPQNSAVNTGQTVQFTPTVNGISNQSVTWSLAGPGTISQSGLYTAPTTVSAAQTATITAASTVDSTKKGTATVTVNPVVVSTCPAPATNAFTGCYYLDQTFGSTGGLGFSRTDPSINFNWGEAGPGAPLGGYNFSVRWQGNFSFAGGSYTISLSTDDGSTLLIDGQQVMSEPGTHAAFTTTQPVTLSAGTHLIELDYFQAGGGAVAILSWTNPQVGISINPNNGSLTAGQTLQFTPIVTGTTNQAVNWSISPAGLGTISASGLYTAPASITSQQTVTVIAASAADATKTSSASITLNATVVSASCPAPATNAFTGCYYLDQTFGSTAGLGFSRIDPAINFNWGTSGPGSGVGAYNFSVRWQGNFTFAAGPYAFTIATDDGSILYIDGQQVLNEWGDHGAYPLSQTVSLTAGTHLIRVDYYQSGGGAQASLTWANPAIGISLSPNGTNLNAGQPQQFTAGVTGAADPSVIWSLSPAIGTISSSGLYVAPALVPVQQNVMLTATSVADKTKSASASINLNQSIGSAAPTAASCAAPASGAFTGCYYTDQNFGATGNLGFTRTDSQINFDWGTNGPGSGVGAYNFSVRWQGNFTFKGGSYTFTLSTDDGSVLYIDGQSVGNEWGNHGAYPTSQTVTLSSGTHLIEYDYFQAGGGAAANLTWTPNQ